MFLCKIYRSINNKSKKDKDKDKDIKMSPIAKLRKRVNATATTRFYRARRLRLKHKVSNATIIYISLLLIFFSLMQAYAVNKEVNSKFVLVMQIFGSVFVLILSLLKDVENHLGASEKMYSCGCALIELKQELDPLIDCEDVDKYTEYFEKYNAILKSYEAMAADDNKIDYLRAKLELTEYYKTSPFERVRIYFLGFLTFCMSYVGYLIFLFSSIFIIFYVIFGWDKIGKILIYLFNNNSIN